MNIKEWVQNEINATQRTPFDFFDECYRKIHTNPCRSNQVVLDANRFKSAGVIPSYVWSVFERLQKASRTLPARAVWR